MLLCSIMSNNQYRCLDCDNKYTLVKNLRRHQQKWHPNQPRLASTDEIGSKALYCRAVTMTTSVTPATVVTTASTTTLGMTAAPDRTAILRDPDVRVNVETSSDALKIIRLDDYAEKSRKGDVLTRPTYLHGGMEPGEFLSIQYAVRDILERHHEYDITSMITHVQKMYPGIPQDVVPYVVVSATEAAKHVAKLHTIFLRYKESDKPSHRQTSRNAGSSLMSWEFGPRPSRNTSHEIPTYEPQIPTYHPTPIELLKQRASSFTFPEPPVPSPLSSIADRLDDLNFPVSMSTACADFNDSVSQTLGEVAIREIQSCQELTQASPSTIRVQPKISHPNKHQRETPVVKKAIVSITGGEERIARSASWLSRIKCTEDPLSATNLTPEATNCSMVKVGAAKAAEEKKKFDEAKAAEEKKKFEEAKAAEEKKKVDDARVIEEKKKVDEVKAVAEK